MSRKQLIFQSIKKNMKNYYLYVFALIFSAALYFAFVTLPFDPALDETKGTLKGAAAIHTGSIILIIIVAVFLLYANNLFIKRRSKEIGLFQLIGMTKGKIFRMLSAENFILYFSSLFIGVFLGFSASKLIMMILFKITGVDAKTELNFSLEALQQTVIVFIVIYLFIMLINYLFIKRQSILSLFHVTSKAEDSVRRMSIVQIVIGIGGIGLIVLGYYLSTILFSGKIVGLNTMFITMLTILGSVILGTYFFFKGSVSFIFHLIRKRKNGHVHLNDVLSLSSIMFRMKSNSLLLTVITTVSALAIGLLSLSYIAYYSTEKVAQQNVPHHFSFTAEEDARQFAQKLDANQIGHHITKIDVIQMEADLSNIIQVENEDLLINQTKMQLSVISEKHVDHIDVSPKETIFTGYSDVMENIFSFEEQGEITLNGKNKAVELQYLGLEDDNLLPIYFTAGGLPTAIVDEQTFERLKRNIDPEIQLDWMVYTGIDMENSADLEQANDLFQEMDKNGPNYSRLQMNMDNKQGMGLMMFIVGFLGLTFLVTSGCILYFKQMDESEEERPMYTILRKLGFTQGDILQGIKVKQLFNFGIPLILGLLHSYFAVKSGWFLFGTEMWTPMLIVMILYTVLYSIFGILSVLYYKKVIQEAL